MTAAVEKRFTFQCWKCHRVYSLFRKVEGRPVLRVKCPYCFTEGVVDLDLYRKPITIFRKDEPNRTAEEFTWEFPETLPTAPVEDAE